MTDDAEMKARIYQRAVDAIRPAPRGEASLSMSRALKENLEAHVSAERRRGFELGRKKREG